MNSPKGQQSHSRKARVAKCRGRRQKGKCAERKSRGKTQVMAPRMASKATELASQVIMANTYARSLLVDLFPQINENLIELTLQASAGDTQVAKEMLEDHIRSGKAGTNSHNSGLPYPLVYDLVATVPSSGLQVTNAKPCSRVKNFMIETLLG